MKITVEFGDRIFTSEDKSAIEWPDGLELFFKSFRSLYPYLTEQDIADYFIAQLPEIEELGNQ